MKFSIIMPSFNCARTITEAVDSVLSQDFQNLELIIQDNSSDAKTKSILDSITDPRVKIYHEHDNGIYNAINIALRKTTGDVIAVLNSDDFYKDAFVLTDVAKAFATYDVDCIHGDLHYVDSNNTNKAIRNWRSVDYGKYSFYFGWMPAHPTFFLKKELYIKNGYYREDLRISSDYDLMLRNIVQLEVKSKHLGRVMVCMRLGGVSNRALSNILRKSFEDFLIISALAPVWLSPLILLMKNVRKLPQFF